MRRVFADEFNLLTIQCDYFGYEFMQGSNSVQLNVAYEELAKIFNKEELKEIYGTTQILNGKNSSLINGQYDLPPQNVKIDLQTVNRGDQTARKRWISASNHQWGARKSPLMEDFFIEIASRYPIQLQVKENLQESMEYFNDMGFMQVLDIITAIFAVMEILKDNQLSWNTNKIIHYGHSHGAYLGHLCNALAPSLFILLIDNSGWLYPNYLNGNRHLSSQIGNMTMHTVFHYLASELSYDKEILHLPYLYQQFENQSSIVTFQGTTDHLIQHVEKERFCKMNPNHTYVEISPKEVDDVCFKSTNHGLDSDLLNVFRRVYTNHIFQLRELFLPSVHSFRSTTNEYTMHFDLGFPRLHMMKKQS